MRHGFRGVAEAALVQGSVEQDTRVVAGERTTAGVGTVKAGPEPDDEKARIGVTEWWYGSREISRVVLPHLGEKTRQPLTAPALGIVALQVGRHLALETQIYIR